MNRRPICRGTAARNRTGTLSRQIGWCCIIAVAGWLSACGGGGDGGGSTQPTTVAGTISFERVPFSSTPGQGLDYDAITTLPAQEIVVELIQQSNQAVLDTTLTGTDGRYQLTAPAGVDVFVRARAHTRSGSMQSGSWDIRVLNNTNSNAEYVLDSSSFNSGAAGGTVTRDLVATSGWGGSSYTGPRAAAPFAIIDTVHVAARFVLEQGDPATDLPALDTFWSVENRSAVGNPNPALGNIGTTAYIFGAGGGFENGIYVLGDANTDTDEFDQHVLAHEFNHYVEDQLSRDDSPGGDHSIGEPLDPRVAFSEGFANAFSGMVLNDPHYRDSFGASQANDFGFDLESNVAAEPGERLGWFNERSIQSIAWDLFDGSPGEANDTISIPFSAMLDVSENELRDGTALTSIFPFIVGLKARTGEDAGIDAIVAGQDIVAVGMDAFASTETNAGGIIPQTLVLPVYNVDLGDPVMNPGGPVQVCATGEAGAGDVPNKLGNRRFLKFSLPDQRLVDINVVAVTGLNPDPDLVLWRAGFLDFSDCAGPDSQSGCTDPQNTESLQRPLTAGDYVLEVYDFNIVPGSSVPTCMNVSVTG